MLLSKFFCFNYIVCWKNTIHIFLISLITDVFVVIAFQGTSVEVPYDYNYGVILSGQGLRIKKYARNRISYFIYKKKWKLQNN